MEEQAAVSEATTMQVDLRSHGPLRQWVMQHDDSWLFTIAYVGLALILSIWISLFWLVVVVGAHFILEWVRQKQLTPAGSNVALLAGWEVKLDIALILFALALTAYMDLLLGVAGLGGAARVGARGAARVGGWGRAIKATLLSLDDVAQIMRVALSRKSKSLGTVGDKLNAAACNPRTEADKSTSAPCFSSPTNWRTWSRGDCSSIGFGVLCLAAIVVAPWLTPHTAASLAGSLMADLHPYPGR